MNTAKTEKNTMNAVESKTEDVGEPRMQRGSFHCGDIFIRSGKIAVGDAGGHLLAVKVGFRVNEREATTTVQPRAMFDQGKITSIEDVEFSMWPFLDMDYEARVRTPVLSPTLFHRLSPTLCRDSTGEISRCGRSLPVGRAVATKRDAGRLTRQAQDARRLRVRG